MKQRIADMVSGNPREEVILMELAFDQFEFDAKVKITAENYDLIRQVFIYAFTKGRESE